LAGTLLFDEKIRKKTALFWLGLRDVGILYLQAVIQRTTDISPAFSELSSVEKIAVWAHANCDPNLKEQKEKNPPKKLKKKIEGG
jgi:hypothetical protein